MVRKMAYVGLSYMAGLFFASFFSITKNIVFLIGIIIISTLYILLFRKNRKNITVIAVSFCIAVFIYILYSQTVYNQVVKYDGVTSTIKGEVNSIKNLEGNKAIYEIKGKINNKENATVLIYSTAKSCEIYDIVKVTAIFNKFENSLSFPAESYYKSKNIFLEATDIKSFEVVDSKSFFIKKSLNGCSDYISEKITTILPNKEGDFLAAILCGDTSNIDGKTKSTLYRVGIGHFVSVSGTHLMIIAGMIFLLLKALRVKKVLRFFILEGIVISFAIFSGLHISVIRAGIMFTILII